MQDPRLLTPDVQTEEELSGFSIRELWRVVFKHKWSIMALTLLIGAISALFVLNQTPLYRAAATLQIERAPAQFSPIQDQFAVYNDAWLYYQTQQELIRRRVIAERVVETLGLHLRPIDTSVPQGFSWRSLLPKSWNKEPSIPTEEQRFEGEVGGLLGSIGVSARRNSQLVDVSVVDVDPLRAAEKANAVAEAFIEDNIEGRVQMAETASSYLTERLVELKQKLEASETALQEYRDREQLVDFNGNEGFAATRVNLAVEKVSSMRRDRSRLQSTYEEIQAVKADGAEALALIPAVYNHPQLIQVNQQIAEAERTISELGLRYGPKHPRMIAANTELDTAKRNLGRQVQIAVSSLESEYRTALSAQRQAESELSGIEDELRELDRKEFDLQTLEREVETNQQIFEQFQKQFKETDAIGGEVQTANARVVEPARPPGAPFRPNKKRSMAVALFIGLLISIGLAFLLEHLDNTLKGVDDVEQRLGIPVLGLLPKLDKETGTDGLEPLRHFSKNPRSIFSEAIRTVRTGVLLSEVDQSHRILLITSSVPSEGKTTLSMNLARAMSDMKRVLLIDADMRRPTVAKAIGSKPVNGLSQFMTGELPITDCVQRRGDSDLYVMPAGTPPPNPLELLSSVRFSQAVSQLADKFDHIVIDCAPTLAVSDAMVLSKLATAVIYVIRNDATPVQAAQSGLKRLKRYGANVIGVVLNQAERKSKAYLGKYSGYYADGYYADYGYVSGYGEKKRKSKG